MKRSAPPSPRSQLRQGSQTTRYTCRHVHPACVLSQPTSPTFGNVLRSRHPALPFWNTLPVSHAPLPASTGFCWNVSHEGTARKTKWSTCPNPDTSRLQKGHGHRCTPSYQIHPYGWKEMSAAGDAWPDHRGSPPSSPPSAFGLQRQPRPRASGPRPPSQHGLSAPTHPGSCPAPGAPHRAAARNTSRRSRPARGH